MSFERIIIIFRDADITFFFLANQRHHYACAQSLPIFLLCLAICITQTHTDDVVEPKQDEFLCYMLCLFCMVATWKSRWGITHFRPRRREASHNILGMLSSLYCIPRHLYVYDYGKFIDSRILLGIEREQFILRRIF